LGLRKIRLIKFRSLKSCTDLARAKYIIETGEFHCSKLWNLNDPMEGIYETSNKSIIDKIFNEKNNYVICSFSNLDALKCPILWGYYANGYKGIAIEIDYNDNNIIYDINNNDEINDRIVKVNYVKETKKINIPDDSVPKIISKKLECWAHEEEYRYLRRSSLDRSFKIGTIKTVYFGNPHGDIINNKKIMAESPTMKCYYEYVKDLCKCIKNKGNIDTVVIFGGEPKTNSPDDCTRLLSENTNSTY
jgi:hypothetical protein